MRTLYTAPRQAASASSAATPASDTAFVFPLVAHVAASSATSAQARAVSSGTAAAPMSASLIAFLRAFAASSGSLGILYALDTAPYESASFCTSAESVLTRPAALSPSSRISASTETYFFLPAVSPATICASAAPNAPTWAATLPPPGVGAEEATAPTNPETD